MSLAPQPQPQPQPPGLKIFFGMLDDPGHSRLATVLGRGIGLPKLPRLLRSRVIDKSDMPAKWGG